MKKTVCFVLPVVFSANLYAFELENLKVPDIKKQVEITLPAPVAEKIEKTAKAYQYLWMRINNNASWKEITANDYSTRIEVRVRKVSDGQFDVNSRVDMAYEWAAIRQVLGREYQLSGNGMYLYMNEFGGSYTISGNVTGENNQIKYINLSLYKRFDAFSYDVSDFGINLNADRNGISGNFDTEQYSKKAVSAITSLILALQLNASQNPANP